MTERECYLEHEFTVPSRSWRAIVNPRLVSDRSINFVELKPSHRRDLHQKLVNIDKLSRSLHKSFNSTV